MSAFITLMSALFRAGSFCNYLEKHSQFSSSCGSRQLVGRAISGSAVAGDASLSQRRSSSIYSCTMLSKNNSLADCIKYSSHQVQKGSRYLIVQVSYPNQRSRQVKLLLLRLLRPKVLGAETIAIKFIRTVETQH